MIRFTAVPAAMRYTVCTHSSEECPEQPTVYVWDDEEHEDSHPESQCTTGLCMTCWHGHATCQDESHVADVINRVQLMEMPA